MLTETPVEVLYPPLDTGLKFAIVPALQCQFLSISTGDLYGLKRVVNIALPLKIFIPLSVRKIPSTSKCGQPSLVTRLLHFLSPV